MPPIASLDYVNARIVEMCDELGKFLVSKNISYNNSVMNPRRIFTKLPPSELISVRIEDKLSRIASGDDTFKEDAEWDLVGYLILLRIAKRIEAGKYDAGVPKSSGARKTRKAMGGKGKSVRKRSGKAIQGHS